MKHKSIIVVGLWMITLSCCGSEQTRNLVLNLRQLEERDGKWRVAERTVQWNPYQTAVIICDMWDNHTCKSAAARVAEMATVVNQVVNELRRRGAFIIHCPSDTMKFYESTPQRTLAQSAPKVATDTPLRWCVLDPGREAPLPIDDSDGGCDDEPRCKYGKMPPYPWIRQHAAIEIKEGDAITDSTEAYYLMRQRGLTNVLVLGVHENMCVLGRSFGIRQMVKLGQNVALVRDLTDTMYNSRRKPFVDHFTGTDLVTWHIEKYWCPTLTSDQIIGGKPFRFKADIKPPRQFMDFANLLAPKPR